MISLLYKILPFEDILLIGCFEMKFQDLHFGFRCFAENSVSLCSLEKLLQSLYPLITHVDSDNWSGCKIDSVAACQCPLFVK